MPTASKPVRMMKKVYGKKAKLRQSLQRVLQLNNQKTAYGDRVASFSTQRSRSEIIHQGFDTIFEKYKLTDIKGFGLRHMEYLVEDWIERNLAPKTIQNRFSTFRLFCEWINKKGMILNLAHYTDDPSIYAVGTVSYVDKSWTSRGVDPRQKIDEICVYHPLIAYQLELMWAFGLRPRESFLLRGIIAKGGGALHVAHGAKGGRDRFVPIETEDQMELLKMHSIYANHINGSLIPSKYDFIGWKKKFYREIGKFGIKKNIEEGGEGVTAYGLRHEYANATFELLTGSETVVRAISLEHDIDELDRKLEERARLEVAERLGHGRTQITGMYAGPSHSSAAAKRAREEYKKKKEFGKKLGQG